MSAHPARGCHCLADLYGIDIELLADSAGVERLLLAAARAAGAQTLFSRFHSFGERQGVTGVVLLAESHLSIHTWPEANFAAADIFMCGAADAKRALAVIVDAWRPQAHALRTIARGAPLRAPATKGLAAG